jgi:oligopeptidase B
MPKLEPPIAKVVPTELTAFGDTRTDPYYYMRHREDPSVIEYIEAENAYTAAVMQPVEPLVAKVYDEIISRIQQTDMSLPSRFEGYFYYTRTEEGKQYSIVARKQGSLDAAEEVLLDQNEMAKGEKFFSLGGTSVSPNQELLAYSTDTTGYREYTLRVKNLGTGEDLVDKVEKIGGIAWAEDGVTLFYSKQQPKTKRSYQIWRHTLGTPASDDTLVYEELDDKFNIGISKTLSKKFLLISIQSGLTSEYRYLDASTPAGEFQTLIPRRPGISYGVAHHTGHFYIRVNDTGRDFRVVTAPVEDPREQNWLEVIPAQNGLYVQSMTLLKRHAAFLLRVNGLHTLRVIDLATNARHDIEFDEQAYTLSFGGNAEFDTDLLRFSYSSMVIPQSTYDYNLNSRERTLMKRQEVLGGYNPDNYIVERLTATSKDGTQVPVTVAYRKGYQRNGNAPMLLYGYGSYAIPIDPAFSGARLSLLDRGFAYAIAHIRGGTDGGYSWYEDGKLLRKQNTFDDFIACAELLIRDNYTSSKMLVIEGASAGGLLVGAVTNARPDLFAGVIAGVPFVDVVSSLQDKTIPLSTTDADEFGDPDDPNFYSYMKSYSPYDNVAPASYPSMYIFSSMNDSQVPYWEPVKWTAKLRANQRGTKQILLNMNMDAGHGGASGRYDRIRELGKSYAFAITAVGLKD